MSSTVKSGYLELGCVVFLDNLKLKFVMDLSLFFPGGCRCRDRMVVGFITTYAISAYHH